MNERKGSRFHILAALEGILGNASDKQMEALDQALRDRREVYPTRKMPLFLEELINTLEDECGYRFRMEEGTDQEELQASLEEQAEDAEKNLLGRVFRGEA